MTDARRRMPPPHATPRDVDPSPRPGGGEIKIFGIGLSRTGTTTLAAMMARLGFTAIHMPLSAGAIDAHRFSDDTPVAARFAELDRRYRGALFVYTTRERRAWLASMRRWMAIPGWRAWYGGLDSEQRRWVDAGDERLYGQPSDRLPALGDADLLAAFDRHDAGVRTHFQSRPDDVLVLDVTDAGTLPYSALVGFLEQRAVLRVPRLNPAPTRRRSVGARADAFEATGVGEIDRTTDAALDPTIDAVLDPAAMVERGAGGADDLGTSGGNDLARRRVDAAEGAFRLAHAWERLGRPERAIASLRQCIEARPDRLDACRRLVALLLRHERHDEARRWAEHGLSWHPQSAELHKALIGALIATAGFDAAFARHGLARCDARELSIQPGEILCCLVERNEAARLPYFLAYYRGLGVDRFLAIDNDSGDGSLELLLAEPDVHVWRSSHSFAGANFGSAWFELLLQRYGVGHWCLTLDADELLVYPGCERRPLRAMCTELEAQGKSALGATLLDMYGEGPIMETAYSPGQPFLEACPYFDQNHFHARYADGGPYHNQTTLFGGARERVFGNRTQVYLNKVPLLRYAPDCLLAGGQHWTNHPADAILDQGAMVLHFKFFASFAAYALREVERGEHYHGAYQYRHYAAGFRRDARLTLYDPRHSVRYEDSWQLVRRGMMRAPVAPAGLRPPHAPHIAAVDARSAAHEDRPFWSVMITVFDRAHLIEHALGSIVAQAAPEDGMEIVVVQDGGAPREVRVAVARIVADLDAGQGRVRLHRCPRRLGQPEIFNACVRLARGRWVHVLPDDDWVEPGFYAALRAGIEGSPAGSAFCRYAAHAADGGEWLSRLEREEPGILGDWLPRTATLCRQVVAATVVRRDVYEALGGFSAAAGTAFDWEMWQRAATYYPVWYEPRRLVVSRSDGTALSDGLRRTGQSVIDSLAAIDLAQTYLPPGLASDLRGGARRRYARHALGVAEQALARSDYRAALENLRASLLAHHDETTWPRVMAVLEASAR